MPALARATQQQSEQFLMAALLKLLGTFLMGRLQMNNTARVSKTQERLWCAFLIYVPYA